VRQSGFRCATCGQWHPDLPLSFGADRPASWYDVPTDRIASDVLLSSDQCVITNKFFFIRGNIQLPIIDSVSESFSWGVWVSVSQESFEKVHDLWETAGREHMIEPLFGWLDTSLPLYPETRLLKTNVHTQPVGTRPLIELEPTDHPLAVEQRQGITMTRVEEIARRLLHN
jgi:hypothetical protein